ncbi:MAG TPA: hypothetical protein EYG03_14695 [Planctomycetes bacterium]|nr:hypothetical protein [Planctomycetota bacterium]
MRAATSFAPHMGLKMAAIIKRNTFVGNPGCKVTEWSFCARVAGGWTELAKEAPEFHSYLARTPALFFNCLPTIQHCVRKLQ